MNDQEYRQLQEELLTLDPTQLDTNGIQAMLEKVTALHLECDRRSMEYWSGKRSLRSVQGRKLTTIVNALGDKLHARLSLSKRGVYALHAR